MPPRVLIVDDEESVTITMAAILEMDGYSVATALRADDALAQIEAEEFDLVLTDLRLDDFDGMDVLAAARRKSRETVGIVLTGYASLESAVKALREGAYDYMLKPADVEELRATVARGLERRKLGEQLRARVADLEAANRTINELNEGLQDRVARATAELQARVRDLDEARTELQSSYEKLQELDKLKSQFLSIASHELKTPLTALLLSLQLLSRRVEREAPQNSSLRAQVLRCESAAVRMSDLIHALLDVAQIHRGRLTLNVRELDIVETVRRVASGLEVTHGDGDGDRIAVHAAGPVTARLDPLRFEQIVTNLLSNAVKYGAGKPIEVRVDRDRSSDVAHLEVIDAGPGIDPTMQEKIFEPFQRVTSTEPIPGLGLGLYVVKLIVESHGGRIAVDSELGHGARFVVDLPRAGMPQPLPQ